MVYEIKTISGESNNQKNNEVVIRKALLKKEYKKFLLFDIIGEANSYSTTVYKADIGKNVWIRRVN